MNEAENDVETTRCVELHIMYNRNYKNTVCIYFTTLVNILHLKVIQSKENCMYARKRIYHDCLAWIEKSVGITASDAKQSWFCMHTQTVMIDSYILFG